MTELYLAEAKAQRIKFDAIKYIDIDIMDSFCWESGAAYNRLFAELIKLFHDVDINISYKLTKNRASQSSGLIHSMILNLKCS